MRNRSFAEGLAPLETSLRQREDLVRPVSQFILRLSRDGDRAPFEFARETVLEWMARGAGKLLPDEAGSGESFTIDNTGSQRKEASAIPDPQYRAVRLDDADEAVARRVWTTEMGIGGQTEGSALIGCRLQCVTRGDDVASDRSVPRFIRDIVEQNVAELDGRRLSVEPRFVKPVDQVEELVHLLFYRCCRRDVIVFSLPEGSTTPDERAASAVEAECRASGINEQPTFHGARCGEEGKTYFIRYGVAVSYWTDT